MANEFDEREAQGAFEDLLQLLERIPGGSKFRADVVRLKALIVDRRPPRLVIVGRRGHGKSSIANAILGYPKLAVGHVGDQPADEEWVRLDVDGCALDWLDTSGIGAGGIVAERLDKLKSQVTQAFPDVIIIAVKASEVDSEIDATLTAFSGILDVLRENGATVPVVALVTKTDELYPARQKVPPYTEAKQKLISEALDRLKAHLERHHITIKSMLAVSAYMEFNEGSAAIEFDGRWNIDRLGEEVFAFLPEEAMMEAARAFQSTKSLRQKVAKRIVVASSSVAFAVGLTPIPLSDVAVLAPLQVAMVGGINRLGGQRWSAKEIGKWLVSLGVVGGGSIGLRLGVQQLVKLIPGAGSFISAGIAGAATWGIGMSAISFFIDDNSLDEAGQIFNSARKRAKDWSPDEVTDLT